VIQRPINLQTPIAGNQSVQRTQAAQDRLQADRRCYNCGEKGHYANQCPNPRTHANHTATATPAPTSGLPSRTMLMGESTMLLWRKPRKLRMLSLICFSSMTLLQLCYLILGHHILSYLLHMFRSIICP
jgi:hypothetical protein